MKTYNNPNLSAQQQLIQRPKMDTQQLNAVIVEVFETVQRDGDTALREFTARYDGVALTELGVTPAEISAAESMIAAELKESIDVAYDNVHKFHAAQQESGNKIETTTGVECWRESRAIDRVGLYIPGGSAPLFSTVLMLGVPAQIAGCSEIVLCTPPQRDGSVHPAILYAAQRCGIRRIYKVGGSQAIAAMVFGTDTIPSVYKLFGPGNQYVTAAKQMSLNYGVAIDMPAGPSEVLVYADSTSDPEFIAADLLSQAEHGPDSQVVLVTTEAAIIGEVVGALERQTAVLPRKEIVEQAMAHSYAVVFDDERASFDFINRYAPEHLIISTDDADSTIPMIQNAGSVFLGHLTPESAGDYASGTNHTLPTAGYATAYSGVSLDSFIKKITFQKISKEGLQQLGPHIVNMAKAEQLDAHAQAVARRLDSLSK